MVLFNHTTRELTAKVVYYGPGLSGKTTNLRSLHERLDQASTGRLLSLATAQDRTIYFDLLPVELGNIKGYAVRFQLCTVPGQVFYNETRKLVLKGVDGIVFVVDSQWSMLSHNLESYQNLRDNLREMGVATESIPTVIQYNKRDLAGVLSIEALQESLGFGDVPFVEAVASEGRGVVETFKLASKLTFIELMRKLQRPQTSLATARADATGTGRGNVFGPPKPAAASPPPPVTRPTFVELPPSSESPFETSADIPSPSTDEIFGIPLRVPEAPAPEELILPEPPPTNVELRPPDAAPGGPPSGESGEIGDASRAGVFPAAGPAPPSVLVEKTTSDAPGEALPVPTVPTESTTLPESASPARTPADYETLERRIVELEGRLDRVLTALRGAVGEPSGTVDVASSARDARKLSSLPKAEDPGI
jgi:signal recognition particle receptor subunit beta